MISFKKVLMFAMLGSFAVAQGAPAPTKQEDKKVPTTQAPKSEQKAETKAKPDKKGSKKDAAKTTEPAATPAATGDALRIDSNLLKPLRARSIGPAVMGGRVSDIQIDPKDPSVFYIALGTGGVMKTTNNGVTFAPIFEKESVAAVGAIGIAPSDNKIVYVGTGEANDRNSSSWGNGVYKSTDGGGSWKNVGLKTSHTIARVIVHPKDPNTVWVAAMGDLWQPSGERGVFKTTDGGTTWTKVLGAAAPNDKWVGGGDIAIDPSDPNVLYAALYARQRTPWLFSTGTALTNQDVSGVFKSVDGGTTWKKVNGLPGKTGRIGLAVYAKNPKIVYALVYSDEAGGNRGINEVVNKTGGVFRSEDAGETWKRMSPLNPRPFYFSQIRIDPENDKRIYVLGFALHVSDNGGETWREDLFGAVHPDLHALAIDPRNSKRLLLGTDGGAYQSYDGGRAWDHLSKFAAGEFYRLNFDMSTPYRICGGLQDNQNWVGPSRKYSKDGITNADWINIGGGDGFYCVFDQDDSNIVYTESQSGYVHRYDMYSGQVKDLHPSPNEGQVSYRFHWNSPLIASAHNKGVMYLAGNRVFKLTNRGENFDVISPDLSAKEADKIATEGSGAETYGVVYSLAESPVKAGMLWAATDDGKVWLTQDEGANWTDLTANLPAAVKGQWISRIEASWKDANVAYLAVPAYRSGNFAPLAYRTADAGKTWQSIASNLPEDGPVKVVREDPKNPNLLYAGTEFGLFVSFDRGVSWSKFGELPTVAVDDIRVHSRDNDLLIATHGRSIYVADDIVPLQELTKENAAKALKVFPVRNAFGINVQDGSADWTGKGLYRGANPPLGAIINFWVKDFSGEGASIEIKDASDQTVAKLSSPGTPGMNRVVWDLKPSKDQLTEYGGQGSKFVRAGEYSVTVTIGENKETQKFKVELAKGVETR